MNAARPWRRARWKRGICRDCPEPREPGSVFCGGHRGADRERAKLYKRRRAASYHPTPRG